MHTAHLLSSMSLFYCFTASRYSGNKIHTYTHIHTDTHVHTDTNSHIFTFLFVCFIASQHIYCFTAVRCSGYIAQTHTHKHTNRQIHAYTQTHIYKRQLPHPPPSDLCSTMFLQEGYQRGAAAPVLLRDFPTERFLLFVCDADEIVSPKLLGVCCLLGWAAVCRTCAQTL